MRTLHLLPGESQGDTADIVLTPKALELLIKTLQEAQREGYACARFAQRDGVPYSLCIDVVNAPGSDMAWRDKPLAYVKRGGLRYDARKRLYDADLLAIELKRRRKELKHSQQHVAEALGTSRAFVSLVENCRVAPNPRNFTRLCRYLGKPIERYYPRT